MTKSVIKCSKCETRYHYFGDIPNGEFVCELCVFSFKKISVNPNSKKSVVGSFSPKTKQLEIEEMPFIWLKVKNVDNDQLTKLTKIDLKTDSKKIQDKLQKWRANYRCVQCGSVLEIMNSRHIHGRPDKLIDAILSIPFILGCRNCRLTLERLGRNKDPISHHLYVYRQTQRIGGYSFLNSNSRSLEQKRITSKSTVGDVNDGETYDDNDTWTEEDKARIQEEEGLSDEDMANGAWIDF